MSHPETDVRTLKQRLDTMLGVHGLEVQDIIDVAIEWLDANRDLWISAEITNMPNFTIIREGVLREYKRIFKQLGVER